MRALKKLTACALATAIAASISVSAFAAELNSSNKIVLSESESYTPAGQTTVLIVPEANWVEGNLTGLTDDNILYIDQYETAAEATSAITSGLGVKLTDGKLADGNYYVLFGGSTNTDGSFAITAFKCTVGGNTIKFADVNGDGKVDAEDVTRLLRHTTGAELLTYGESDLMAICNVNGDQTVDAEDVTRLLRHTTGAELLTGVEE